MQAKLETSGVRRTLVSLLVIVILVAVVVLNMPGSRLKTAVLDHGGSAFLRATGLDQNWGVFSDPRRVSVYVEGHVRYADGTSSVEPIPHGPWLSALADYRWHKYSEQLRLDDSSRLWEPYARLLAERARKAGREPVQVTLVRRFSNTLPPGPGPEREEWRSFTYFGLPLDQPAPATAPAGAPR
jgi:hypothetical protein